MLSAIKIALSRLFQRKKKQVIEINTEAATIPEAFGYPEVKFAKLIDELTQFIDRDRLQSFKTFIEGPMFEEFELNMNNPHHAALLGYAFCAAVIASTSVATQNAVNSVLRAFYPERFPNSKKTN